MGKNELVLSTIIVIFDVQKLLQKKIIAYQKQFMYILNARKYFMPQKIAQPSPLHSKKGLVRP